MLFIAYIIVAAWALSVVCLLCYDLMRYVMGDGKHPVPSLRSALSLRRYPGKPSASGLHDRR